MNLFVYRTDPKSKIQNLKVMAETKKTTKAATKPKTAPKAAAKPKTAPRSAPKADKAAGEASAPKAAAASAASAATVPTDWAKMIVNQLIEAQRMWLEVCCDEPRIGTQPLDVR